jgi:hypothetical protein
MLAKRPAGWRWQKPCGRLSLLTFVASLPPFGPFPIDRRLAKSAPAGDSAD